MPAEPSKIRESVVEQAATEWLGGLGDEILPGLTIAPGSADKNPMLKKGLQSVVLASTLHTWLT